MAEQAVNRHVSAGEIAESQNDELGKDCSPLKRCFKVKTDKQGDI